jgi:hypothetical protein
MLPLAASSNVAWAASGSHGNGTSVFASNVMVPPSSAAQSANHCTCQLYFVTAYPVKL